MFLTSLLVVGFVFVSVILILVVLIQRPQGGGLSGAFGSGAGSGQTAFGAKTGDALTIATIIMFVIWLGSAVGLVFAARPSASQPQQPAVTAPQGAGEQGATEEGAGDAAATDTGGAVPVEEIAVPTEPPTDVAPEGDVPPAEQPTPDAPPTDTPDEPAPGGDG